MSKKNHKLLLEVEAVAFDLDGVITDTMPYHFQAWRRIFKTLGINVTKPEVYCREGQRGLISIKEISQSHGVKLSSANLRRILGEKEQLFRAIVRTKFVANSRAFIRHLRRKGIRLALVTGTSFKEVEKILPAELRKNFEVIVAGDQVKRGKPHPEPYRRALKKLNVAPARAVVLENAPMGINSAKRAGLTCLALATSLPPSYLREADYVFSDFSQLCDRVVFKGRTVRRRIKQCA